MSLFLPQRPPTNLSFLIPSLPKFLPQIIRRHESSARRTTKRLRTKPDPSFTASIAPANLQDHIVFNPPSSAPSPYHTPPAFLPRNDPRRALLAQSHAHANPWAAPTCSLPPLVRKGQGEKKYHLTQKDVEEIRRLRAQDPYQWTRKKLAEKFECSQFFVGMVAEAAEEKKEKELRKVEEVKERWGRRRRYAREDRQKRRELWERDQ